VVVVVTQPDRPRGRGRQRSPSPVAEVALAKGLPLLRPERVSDPGFATALAAFAPDLGVVVAFGQFLPRRIREAPSLGYLINAHASLLPRLRGAAPIPRAILAGETETGISVMRVEKEMDAGPVALVRRTPIGAEENAGELALRLAGLAAEAVSEAVARAAAGTLRFEPQDPARASFAPKLAREDAFLDWSESAERLARRVRALAPRPGACAFLAGEPLRILAARAEAARAADPPGTVRRGGDPPLRIATGDGWLVPTTVQRAGGRALPVADFLRGHALTDGARLAPPPAAGGAA
jgi:methionyl-tRNA formyltransferase